MIITDVEKLKQKCKRVSLIEADPIYHKLINELSNHPNGVGLAAPQIGIYLNVCIIKFKENILLVNPVIKKQYNLIEFRYEGCLSFNNVLLPTKRYSEILVVDDVHPNGFISTGVEAVIVSHEIDHLNGITIHDRAVPRLKDSNTCWCGSGKKYRKCHKRKIVTF